MEFPWLREAEIEAVAHTLLDRSLGTNRDRRLPDLDAIVYDYLSEKEGLSFDNEANLGVIAGEEVLGKTLPIAGKILIARSLGATSERGRYRFTVAHELGHWVLHRPLFLAAAEAPDLFAATDEGFAFVSLDRAIRPDAWRTTVDRPEWQANRFATALLIDADALREAFVERFGRPVVARRSSERRSRGGTLREHSRSLATFSVTGLRPLADAFGLSAAAMAVTLEMQGYAVEQEPIL